MRFHTWRAGEIKAQHAFQLAIRAGAAGFGGTEERDHRLAERGGGVHRAGVVGDHQFASPQPLDHFGQRSFTAQIQTARWCRARNNFAQRFISCDAENGKTRFRKFFCKQADKFGKMFGWPAFV